jgi:hypothetical protein
MLHEEDKPEPDDGTGRPRMVEDHKSQGGQIKSIWSNNRDFSSLLCWCSQFQCPTLNGLLRPILVQEARQSLACLLITT